MLYWSGLAWASMAAGLVVFGLRPDPASAVDAPRLIATTLFALGAAVAAGFGSLVLAVPGAERSRALWLSAAGLLAAWTVWLAIEVLREGYLVESLLHSPACFTRVIAIGAVPGITLFVMLRRAAPLKPALTGALALAAAASFGALAIQFICPLDDAAHGLLGHLGPVLTLGLAGAWAGRGILRL
jgi:hypothetical protein